jgi:hypothetical protein
MPPQHEHHIGGWPIGPGGEDIRNRADDVPKSSDFIIVTQRTPPPGDGDFHALLLMVQIIPAQINRFGYILETNDLGPNVEHFPEMGPIIANLENTVCG